MASYNKRISDQSKVKFNPINRELEDSDNSELDSRVDNLEENILGSKTTTGNPLTVTDAAPGNAVNLSMDLEPIQAGSGTPSPDNIRPISGRSEVAIERVGKNWLNYSSDNVGWASDKTAIVDVLNSLPEGTYTLTVPFTLTSISGDITNAKCQVRIDTNFTPIYIIYNKTWGSATIGTTKTITCQIVVDSSVKGKFTNCYLYGCGIDGVGARGTASVSNVQLELGTTATTYEPYKGKTYTIQLGDTVYGGTLDVTRGKMVVDRGYIASYNGETLPSTWISDRDVYASGTSPTTGAQVVYELATPITIQLTPQQIKLLENTNTLYTDYEGDTITIEYRLNNTIGEILGELEDIYNKIDDIYNKIESLDTRVTALEES